MFYHFFQERRPTPSSQLVVELLTQAKSHCPSWTPGQAGSNSAGCQPAPPGLCFGAQIPCVKGKVVETPLKSVGSVLLVIRQLSLSTTAQSPKQRIIQKPSSLWLSSSLMKYDYFGTIHIWAAHSVSQHCYREVEEDPYFWLWCLQRA